MSARQSKVAVIRLPGYPVGQPAPCYLNCPCGAKPTTIEGVDTPCQCGRTYDDRGWLLKEPTK